MGWRQMCGGGQRPILLWRRAPGGAERDEASWAPLTLEASLQLSAGEGLLLTPSLVCERGARGVVPSVVLRSDVRF